MRRCLSSMTHLFKHGVIWDAGAGGNHIMSYLVPKNNTQYLEYINEYITSDDLKYHVRPTVSEIKPQQTILASHKIPVKFFETQDIMVDDLAIILPNWFSCFMLEAKRMFNVSCTMGETSWLLEKAVELGEGMHMKLPPSYISSLCDILGKEYNGLTTRIDNQCINFVYLYGIYLKARRLPHNKANISQFVESELLSHLHDDTNLMYMLERWFNSASHLADMGKINNLKIYHYEEIFLGLTLPFAQVNKHELANYSLKNIGLAQLVASMTANKDLDQYLNRATNVIFSNLN